MIKLFLFLILGVFCMTSFLADPSLAQPAMNADEAAAQVRAMHFMRDGRALNRAWRWYGSMGVWEEKSVAPKPSHTPIPPYSHTKIVPTSIPSYVHT